MFIRDTKRLHRSDIEKVLGKNATGEDVLDYIFGTWENDYNSDSGLIISIWDESDRKTMLQRFNMLWVVPLTFILAPFNYVLKGCIGWDTKSKIGRWFIKITGNLKEQRMSKINKKIVEKINIDNVALDKIKLLHSIAENIINFPELWDNPLLKLGMIEYELQLAWGLPLDESYHYYSFKLKDCICPKEDNMLMLGSGMFLVDVDCKYHGIKQEVLNE